MFVMCNNSILMNCRELFTEEVSLKKRYVYLYIGIYIYIFTAHNYASIGKRTMKRVTDLNWNVAY